MKTAVVITLVAVVAAGAFIAWQQLTVKVEVAPSQPSTAAPSSSHLPAGDFDTRKRLVPPGDAAGSAPAQQGSDAGKP